MASLQEVSQIIHAIAIGLEDECVKCLDERQEEIIDSIHEQLYSGLDGTEHLLSPSYDEDSYFSEPGPWQNRAEAYKRWKEKITPPIRGEKLYLPPRPVEVPNLFIVGSFYESIHAERIRTGLHISSSGFKEGPDIERKYGEQILCMSDTAKAYFNLMFMRPCINRFFRNCGYK